MGNIYFYHEHFGKCKVLGFFRNIAIIELKNQVEKYVVAVGFSRKERRWIKGFYYRDYDEAVSTYALLAFD